MAKLGTLEFLPVEEHLDLVASPVAKAIETLEGADQIGVTEIDATVSDTASFCEKYQIGPELAANCVIIEGKFGEERKYIACIVLATTRIDVNGKVREVTGAKKASFAKMEDAVRESGMPGSESSIMQKKRSIELLLPGMEYGAITPIGLPVSWPILIDAAVAASNYVIIGSGFRKSKLALPGKVLASLPNAQVVEGLGRKSEAQPIV
jgi:prolyl-tRNA editing enzyme YbaK/EbsC (Cys-tRNA(Pro) deacylase)